MLYLDFGVTMQLLGSAPSRAKQCSGIDYLSPAKTLRVFAVARGNNNLAMFGFFEPCSRRGITFHKPEGLDISLDETSFCLRTEGRHLRYRHLAALQRAGDQGERLLPLSVELGMVDAALLAALSDIGFHDAP